MDMGAKWRQHSISRDIANVHGALKELSALSARVSMPSWERRALEAARRPTPRQSEELSLDLLQVPVRVGQVGLMPDRSDK